VIQNSAAPAAQPAALGYFAKQVHQWDQRISASIAKLMGCAYFKSDVTGEGGGIEYDGDGMLILNDSCWVNENLNPGWSREKIELELKAGLGVQKVIWLPGVRGRSIRRSSGIEKRTLSRWEY
jgi:agmatine deiminase